VNKLRLITFIGVAGLISAALCSTAQAQLRVFVSGLGDDLNPCTRTAPCRNFQRGHDVVAAGGEVVALDSAGFGKVSITKSVTLTGEGVYAGITATSGDGIAINSATAVVVLRNLSMYGLGTGDNGILVSDAASLHVENCVIQGFFDGLFVSNLANSGIQTFVKDTVMRNNTANEVGAGNAIFENCRLEKNASGLLVRKGAKVTVHNCVVAGNSNIGLFSFEMGSQIMVDNCQISNNSTGIYALMGQVRVSNSEITNNGVGLAVSGGTLLSRVSSGVATNTVEDNGANGAFTGTYSAQ
jgi:nitrous oxidase accessory protein NosD